MNYCFVLLLSLTSFFNAWSQEINTLFELKLDSIEQKITDNKWGSDTSYYLLYTVKNTSADTLTYTTNSCFYYNHCSLKTENAVFDLNPTGGCIGNMVTPVTIAPGASFSRAEWITANGLNTLTAGDLNVTLAIPLVKDQEHKYRVDGRDFVENATLLTFTGKTKVVQTTFNHRKRKKSA